MITILVADDERWMRKTIRGALDWERYDMTIIAEAEDGLRALELIQRLSPDLVLADIQMPGMDGLELLRKAKEQDDPPEFIFFSGYDRFEYVKTAMNCGAIGYLLKPVVEEELVELLLKASDHIRTARTQRLHRHRQSLTRLLHEGIVEGTITEQVGQYAAWICEFDGSAAEEMHVNLLADWIEGRLHAGKHAYGAVPIHNKVEGFVGVAPERANLEQGLDLIQQIIKKYERQNSVSISLGIGHWVHEARLIPDSYVKAQEALEYRLLQGAGGCYNWSGLPLESEPLILLDMPVKQHIASFLKCGDDAVREDLLEAIEQRIRSAAVSPKAVKRLIYSFLDIIYRHFAERGFATNPVHPESLYLQFCQSVGWVELMAQFRALLLTAGDCIRIAEGQDYNKLVEAMRVYMIKHYAGDITLDVLARQFHFSPNYLSRLFREAEGESVSDYVTKLRIDKAKELLSDVRLSVNEVAQRVGYKDNPKYFTKVFKKLVGVTPVEFAAR